MYNQQYEFSCNDCGKQLHLDERVVSKSGKKIPLELNGQIHDCPNKEAWVSDPFKCRTCQTMLYVSDDEMSKSGKRIPFEIDNDEPHQCANKAPSKFPCRGCAMMIFVSPTRLSKSGKKIPLDVGTGNPHKCSKFLDDR